MAEFFIRRPIVGLVTLSRLAEIAELRGRYDLLTHREHKWDTCETTVQIHRGHVMRKMRSGSLTDLVRMAERLGDV
jgi:hypothetical protein